MECDRLREAAEDGDVDDIKTLASSGVDVNAVVYHGVSNIVDSITYNCVLFFALKLGHFN